MGRRTVVSGWNYGDQKKAVELIQMRNNEVLIVAVETVWKV